MDVSARVVPEQRRQSCDIVGNERGILAGERRLHLGAHVRQVDIHHAGSGGRGARHRYRDHGQSDEGEGLGEDADVGTQRHFGVVEIERLLAD